MKTNFETFKSGDVVRVKRDFPFVDHALLKNEIYIVEKMMPDAGIVTLRGLPFNRTFPEGAFEMVEHDRYYLNGDC
jgi:hypothetical protein